MYKRVLKRSRVSSPIGKDTDNCWNRLVASLDDIACLPVPGPSKLPGGFRYRLFQWQLEWRCDIMMMIIIFFAH